MSRHLKETVRRDISFQNEYEWMVRATFAILLLVMHLSPSECFQEFLTTSEMKLFRLEIYSAERWSTIHFHTACWRYTIKMYRERGCADVPSFFYRNEFPLYFTPRHENSVCTAWTTSAETLLGSAAHISWPFLQRRPGPRARCSHGPGCSLGPARGHAFPQITTAVSSFQMHS